MRKTIVFMFLMTGMWGLAGDGSATESASKAALMGYAKQVEGYMKRISDTYDKVHRYYEGPLSKTTTPEHPAYAAVSQALAGVEGPYAAIKADGDSVAESASKIKVLFGETRAMSEGDPQWKELKGLIKELKEGGSSMQKDLTPLNKALQEFALQVNKNGLWEARTESVGNKLERQTDKIERMRSKHDSLGKRRLTGKAKKAYQEMGEALEGAESSLQELRQMATEFKKSPEAKAKYLYGGPGVKSNLVVQEMKRGSKQMDGFFKKFKKDYIRIEGKAAWKEDESEDEEDEESIKGVPDGGFSQGL